MFAGSIFEPQISCFPCSVIMFALKARVPSSIPGPGKYFSREITAMMRLFLLKKVLNVVLSSENMKFTVFITMNYLNWVPCIVWKLCMLYIMLCQRL